MHIYQVFAMLPSKQDLIFQPELKEGLFSLSQAVPEEVSSWRRKIMCEFLIDVHSLVLEGNARASLNELYELPARLDDARDTFQDDQPSLLLRS